MASIYLCVGTVYGSSVEVAEEVTEILKALGHEVSMTLDPSLAELQNYEQLLLLTASTGMGDIPDNLMGFYCEILDESPDLSAIKFAVIGMGDSSYDYFNGAALRLNEVLLEQQADQITEPLLVDANLDTEPAERIANWLANVC